MIALSKLINQCLFFILSFFLFVVPVSADERILSFHSDIEVLASGDLKVVETIKVNAEGNQIKRGIYRDLPTAYPHPKYAWLGLQSKTRMELQSVLRNGRSEPYHVKPLQNGKRFYFGASNKFLKKTEHVYKFTYIAERQISLESADAELYWNVTGNGWDFPIDKATASIRFPNNSNYFEPEAWTGPQGSSEQNASFSHVSENRLRLMSDKHLPPQHGLTVRVKFNKSSLVIAKQSVWRDLYRDNQELVFGLLLLLAMLIIFFIGWIVNGIDPKKGIIVARYRPLDNISAAAHRAFHFNKVDDTSFAVGLLSAAIKGWVTIEKISNKAFCIRQSDRLKPEPLSPTETILVDGLLNNVSQVTIGNFYDEDVAQVKKEYSRKLRKNYAQRAHKSHRLILALGMIIGLVGLVVIVISSFNEERLLPYFIGYMLGMAISAVFLKKFAVSDSLAYSLSFTAIIIAMIALYMGDFAMVFSFCFFAIVSVVFAYLLPAPKRGARKLLDKIEGFRLYLSKAEHDSLKRLTLPTKTPQLYEELLPYAVALDLETEWSDQFTQILALAKQSSAENDSYDRSWYMNNGSTSNNLTSGIAAGLAASVVAASTPPSSSSSSSGGSSGGGGGGGGGGGW